MSKIFPPLDQFKLIKRHFLGLPLVLDPLAAISVNQRFVFESFTYGVSSIVSGFSRFLSGIATWQPVRCDSNTATIISVLERAS